ncbi:glycosyltransferase [Roseovarius aestuarii]|uniref:Putative glycosyltransferase EpsE n=1 Tax=Roseovarius aestuarii TaxID=475083 RepID=A0A1X7BMA5_9RHOB|nr:glycosyltransferase [Roseovarius aestuarii]SMC10756.1 Putative glycosyltransferase EpsE [Roseovarius aestuarii]
MTPTAPSQLPDERPQLRYSVVILSYNQEDYIGDAIRSVLTQECFPVEILVSDDCSTDGTFHAAQRAVEGYRGPHSLHMRRNPKNMGLIAHINQIVETATGDVIIPAYGDDISLPSRVAEIAKLFEARAPLLVHSDAIAIDENGNETRSHYRKADFYRTTDALQTATSMALYLGASGAWHRELFSKYGPIRHPNVYEDHILGFRAALENRVAFIDKPLLKYREGVGISHQLNRERHREDAGTRRRKILDMMIATFSQRLADAATHGMSANHAVMKKLLRAKRKAELRRACYGGIGRMVAGNLSTPGAALSAAAAEGLRIIRRR